jgi:OOP family OmpA-OmpF porin
MKMKTPKLVAIAAVTAVTAVSAAFAPFVATAAEPDPTTAATRPAVEKVVVRARTQFDFDRDQLRADDRQRILDELGAAGSVTWQSVNAVGYTDSVGSADYNQALSDRRAAAVKSFLVSKGVAPDMIATSGKGADEPLADNGNADGRAQNRRTMIEFQGVRATAAR